MIEIEIARIFSIVTFLPILLYTPQKWPLVQYFGFRVPRQPNNGPGFATMHRLKARHSSGDSARNATL
jgi:hypothetical protein